jgi:hypothetical protein
MSDACGLGGTAIDDRGAAATACSAAPSAAASKQQFKFFFATDEFSQGASMQSVKAALNRTWS